MPDMFVLNYQGMTERVKTILWRSAQIATEEKDAYIRTDHIARALLEDKDPKSPHHDIMRTWLKNKVKDFLDES